MGKRTRLYLNDRFTVLNDKLNMILARLPERTDTPAGITTYHATDDPDIWLRRTQTEVGTAEAMDWHARMHAPESTDFTYHPPADAGWKRSMTFVNPNGDLETYIMGDGGIQRANANAPTRTDNNPHPYD